MTKISCGKYHQDFISLHSDSQNWKIRVDPGEHSVQLIYFTNKEMETKAFEWHMQGHKARWKLVSSRDDTWAWCLLSQHLNPIR